MFCLLTVRHDLLSPREQWLILCCSMWGPTYIRSEFFLLEHMDRLAWMNGKIWERLVYVSLMTLSHRSCRRLWKCHWLYVYSPFFPHNRCIDPCPVILRIYSLHMFISIFPRKKSFHQRVRKTCFFIGSLNQVKQADCNQKKLLVTLFPLFLTLSWGVWENPIHHGLRTFDQQLGDVAQN